jgi:hypothetical protein
MSRSVPDLRVATGPNGKFAWRSCQQRQDSPLSAFDLWACRSNLSGGTLATVSSGTRVVCPTEQSPPPLSITAPWGHGSSSRRDDIEVGIECIGHRRQGCEGADVSVDLDPEFLGEHLGLAGLGGHVLMPGQRRRPSEGGDGQTYVVTADRTPSSRTISEANWLRSFTISGYWSGDHACSISSRRCRTAVVS